jgi:hypothetical protein
VDIYVIIYLLVAGICSGASATMWALLSLSARPGDPNDFPCLSAIVIAAPAVVALVFMGLALSSMLFPS